MIMRRLIHRVNFDLDPGKRLVTETGFVPDETSRTTQPPKIEINLNP
jgi:hypothetical protein